MAIVNDFAFLACWNLFLIQKKWLAVKGNYFQGKATMPEPPDYVVNEEVRLGMGLTDLVEDWRSVGYEDRGAPAQLTCDIYEAPSGHGFTVTVRVRVGEAVWRFQMHRGPESYRDAGNYRWVREPDAGVL